LLSRPNWPWSLLPQVHTLPSLFSARVWSWPMATMGLERDLLSAITRTVT